MILYRLTLDIADERAGETSGRRRTLLTRGIIEALPDGVTVVQSLTEDVEIHVRPKPRPIGAITYNADRRRP